MDLSKAPHTWIDDYCKVTNFRTVNNFRTFDLKLVRTYQFTYFRGSAKKMTLKFNGFKAKTNFHTILNFVLFQKYEMYKNKFRTKICDFTVPADLIIACLAVEPHVH